MIDIIFFDNWFENRDSKFEIILYNITKKVVKDKMARWKMIMMNLKICATN